MDAQAQVIDFLKLNGLPFELRQHPVVHTMDDCAALGLPAPHCKNLFLCNRAATQFYLFLLGADKPFVTREISHALGVSRLSFGKDEPLFAMLHTHPGAVSPMGLIFPEAAPVRLLCDVEGPPGPAGPGGGAYGPPALLHQGPQFRPGLAGRGPHVAEHLVQVQLPQGDWHGAHTRRMAETLSLICLATAGLFMV